jgi:hypothetical protein
MNFDIDREVETAKDAGEQHLAGNLTREVETRGRTSPSVTFWQAEAKEAPLPLRYPSGFWNQESGPVQGHACNN